jgi:YVTN family beta-propeller protein
MNNRLLAFAAAGGLALGIGGSNAFSAHSAAATHHVVAEIPTGSSAAGMTFAARSGRLYVANVFSDDVSVIDPRTRRVVDTVPLVGGTTCAHPLSVGYDKRRDIVYVSCQQYTKATAIDARTDTQIGEPIEVGSSPFSIVYDSRNGDIYIAIAHNNEVVVVDGNSRVVTAHIPVGEAPFGIAYDTRRGHLYVTNTQGDTVSVIDPARNEVVRTIAIGNGPPGSLAPTGIVYDGRNDTVYVGNFNSRTVTALAGGSGALRATIEVGRGPFGMTLNPCDGNLYVAAFFEQAMQVVDTRTNSLIETVALPESPVWAAADPRSGDVFVSHGNSVSVLAAG